MTVLLSVAVGVVLALLDAPDWAYAVALVVFVALLLRYQQGIRRR